jgi:hypothetical protein
MSWQPNMNGGLRFPTLAERWQTRLLMGLSPLSPEGWPSWTRPSVGQTRPIDGPTVAAALADKALVQAAEADKRAADTLAKFEAQLQAAVDRAEAAQIGQAEADAAELRQAEEQRRGHLRAAWRGE